MYQYGILQATCHCYFLLEDRQLFLVTVKAGCLNDIIAGKIAFSQIHPI